jgi:hypothetical protein
MIALHSDIQSRTIHFVYCDVLSKSSSSLAISQPLEITPPPFCAKAAKLGKLEFVYNPFHSFQALWNSNTGSPKTWVKILTAKSQLLALQASCRLKLKVKFLKAVDI